MGHKRIVYILQVIVNLKKGGLEMISKLKNKTFLLILIEIIFLTITLSAQLKRDGLIFSEIYLSENEPNRSWLEIYNPTNTILILEKFRFDSVLSPNILPEEINEKGGINISPGECIVLCASGTGVDLQNVSKLRIVEVEAMRHFRKGGGFFALVTKELGKDGVDIFYYGNPEKTAKYRSSNDDFVVPFTTDAISYTRIKSQVPGDQFQPNFIKTRPSPGSYTEIGGKNE